MLEALRNIKLDELEVDQYGVPVPHESVVKYVNERSNAITSDELQRQFAADSPEWNALGKILAREAGDASLVKGGVLEKQAVQFIVETTVMHIIRYVQAHTEMMSDNDQTASRHITITDFKKSMAAIDEMGFDKLQNLVERDMPLAEMVWMLFEELASGKYGMVSPPYALGMCATVISYAFQSKQQQAVVNNLYRGSDE